MNLKITGMHDFKVSQGYSAETSGGILTMMDPSKAKDFISESKEKYGQTVWQVGKVVKGDRRAQILPDVETLNIKESPFEH
jgi:selenide,water dikinase